MSDKQLFDIIFQNLTPDSWSSVLKEDFVDINQIPYKVQLKNITGYWDPCLFCGDKSCRGCPLPFDSSQKFEHLLERAAIEDNVQFYDHGKKMMKDVQIEIVWSQHVPEPAFKYIQNALVFDEDKQTTSQEEDKMDGEINIYDCFEEFGKTEILDDENMWRCPTCKKDVHATKQLQLYKAPPILVVSLKRFKGGRRGFSSFGMGFMMGGGGGGKIETKVDFPIDGLDITPYVICAAPGEKIIYDLFAVSNHFGGTMGGHYTAFAKNIHSDKWYNFDDSSVSVVQNKSRIVSDSAYNLFFRRRGLLDPANIDYGSLRQHGQPIADQES